MFAQLEGKRDFKTSLVAAKLHNHQLQIWHRFNGMVLLFCQSTDVRQVLRLDAFIRQKVIIYGLKTEIGKVKIFAKAYHEIRYNHRINIYSPSFDTLSLAGKVAIIILIWGFSEKNLGKIKRAKIDQADWTIAQK